MRLVEMYLESQNEAKKPEEEKATGEDAKYIYPAEDIDYRYYIEHTLMNPIDQLFSVGYNRFLKKYESICYKHQHSRCKAVSIVNPLKFVAGLIKDKMKKYLIEGSELTDAEKFQEISQDVAFLPEWFIKKREKIDNKVKKKSRLRILSDDD